MKNTDPDSFTIYLDEADSSDTIISEWKFYKDKANIVHSVSVLGRDPYVFEREMDYDTLNINLAGTITHAGGVEYQIVAGNQENPLVILALLGGAVKIIGSQIACYNDARTKFLDAYAACTNNYDNVPCQNVCGVCAWDKWREDHHNCLISGGGNEPDDDYDTCTEAECDPPTRLIIPVDGPSSID